MANRERRTYELIHCENCGEDYAATYRCCPFCEERPTRGRGGGSRLRSNTRGGGYGGAPSPLRVLGWVLSLALVIAACVIVFNLLSNLLGFGKDKTEGDTPSPPPVTEPVPTPGNTDPTPTPPPVDPTPTPTPPPAASGVSSISLNHTDITLKPNEQQTLKATVNPGSWGGTVVWTADSAAVTITQSGVVTNVNSGSSTVAVTVTATAGDKSATCILRCRPGGSAAATPTPAEGGATSSAVTLSNYDFTIRPQDSPTQQLRASGGNGTYTWSSSNTNVATVSDTGLVTKVGQGRCTITCTSGDSSATCIVRVS